MHICNLLSMTVNVVDTGVVGSNNRLLSSFSFGLYGLHPCQHHLIRVEGKFRFRFRYTWLKKSTMFHNRT